jgi:hypothetical protein
MLIQAGGERGGETLVMPRDVLAHGLLELLRIQRRDGERGDAIALRPQAVPDEGQAPAPDLRAGLPRATVY